MNRSFFALGFCFVLCATSTLAFADLGLTCNQAPPPSRLENSSFKHTRNQVLAWWTPFHIGDDMLVTFGDDAVISGKFTYGSLSKDLEDEEIEVWIDDCSGALRLLGRQVTDGDGRTRHIIQGYKFKKTGLFQIYQRVVGDNSYATSTLRVVQKNSRVVVFDIDGTLTLSDGESAWQIWKRFLNETYIPVAREGADNLTWFWKQKGHELVYLSGRHYSLTSLTRDWLSGGNYAPGTLIHGESVNEIWPNNQGVGAFKVKHLSRLQQSGMTINAAYGNATTDVYAYEQAGISKDITFIVGKHGGFGDTVALGDNFLEHLGDLESNRK